MVAFSITTRGEARAEPLRLVCVFVSSYAFETADQQNVVLRCLLLLTVLSVLFPDNRILLVLLRLLYIFICLQTLSALHFKGMSSVERLWRCPPVVAYSRA